MSKNIFLTLFAGIIFSLQTVAQVTKPTFPGYGACPVSNGTINSDCVKDVNNRYQAALTAYNTATQIISSSYTATVAPVKPAYTCTRAADGTVDNSCENNYANQIRLYSSQNSAYQEVQQQQADLAKMEATATQTRLATTSTGAAASTTSTLNEITQKNQEGSQIYKLAEVGCIGASVVYAGMFAASCSGAGATCQYSLLAKSVAFAVFGAMAGSQAQSHDQSAASACQSQNQLSSAQSTCGGILNPDGTPAYKPDPPISTQISQIAGQIDPVTGKCKPDSPATCTTIVDNAATKGVDVKSLLNTANQFGSGKGPFTVNKDGSVTTKDGKTYTAADFVDEDSMMAAGMSAADAKSLNSELHGSGGVLAKAGLDVKGDLKDLAAKDFGSFGALGDGSVTVKTGADTDSGGLGSKDLSAGGAAGKRKPATAGEDGLSKNFNGDPINVASDDIFKAMKRRYIKKTKQDAFISPE